MVVQRRDGPRWLRELDDDDDDGDDYWGVPVAEMFCWYS